MNSIFNYSNYRVYLGDYYQWLKSKRPSFSYRYLSQKAGINSSSFIKYLIEGKRNLSKHTLNKITRALPLRGAEVEYFETLVHFNQAKSIPEKNQFFASLTQIRNRQSIHKVDPRDYEFYSEWFHPVIRELIVIPGYETPEALAEILDPKITPKQARDSVGLLLDLGFIVRNKNGSYHQKDPIISTGPEVKNTAVINYQMKMLRQSMAAFENAKPGHYTASSSTLGIALDDFSSAKEIIRKCRAQLLELASKRKIPDKVYQLNINMFPITRDLHEVEND